VCVPKPQLQISDPPTYRTVYAEQIDGRTCFSDSDRRNILINFALAESWAVENQNIILRYNEMVKQEVK
jgi:hypothetical protein